MSMYDKRTADYTGIMGVQVVLLTGTDGPCIRIHHAELTRCGDDGIRHLMGFNVPVEVLYHKEKDATLATSHAVVLNGAGIKASVIPV